MKVQNIQSFYRQLQSAPFAQQYLKQSYEKRNVQDSEKKSYENTYRFMYFIEHANTYYDQGRKAPLSVQPVLYFYGMAQLLKAWLLTIRPDYPESTSVLAHGASSRKRKKQNYSFLQDEVKIQYKGLFTYAAKHLFHVEQFTSEKFTMNDLLQRIPEVSDVYEFLTQQQQFYCIGSPTSKQLTIPKTIIDDYHWTTSYFSQQLKQSIPSISDISVEKEHVSVQLQEPMYCSGSSFFYLNSEENQLTINKRRHLFPYFPEILTHYLVLYNLSMICRYETEWWGDVLHSFSSEDVVYIQRFLEITEQKIPMLIAHDLMRNSSSHFPI